MQGLFQKDEKLFEKVLDVFTKTLWRIHECALARWRISLDAFGSSSKRVKWRFSKRVKRFYRLCFCVPIYMKVCVSTLHPLHLDQSNEWFSSHFFERWTVWRVREACYMFMRIRVRVIKLRCSITLPWSVAENTCWRTHLQISELAKSLQKVWKKWLQTFGGYVVKQ